MFAQRDDAATHLPPPRYFATLLTVAALAALAGGTLIPQPYWLATMDRLGVAAAFVGAVGGAIGGGYASWTRRTQWVVLILMVPAAGMIGLLARMVAHGLALHGR